MRLLLVGLLFILSCFSASASENTIYKVAVIDRFYPPVEGFSSEADKVSHRWLYGMVDIDRDDTKEPFYHGDIVRMIAAHSRVTFITYPIQDNRPPMGEIRRNLRKIKARLSCSKPDALILSWESSTLMSIFDPPLKQSRASQYKAVIKKMGKTDPVWEDTYAIIELLEDIAAQGIAVYTISGNGGRGMINTFSFAKGVVTVGASEKELSHYIANNPFVDIYAQAAYELQRIDDREGNTLGYDINGDKCVDIPASKLSSAGLTNSSYPRKHWRTLIGSSFAAPAALREALFSKLELTQCFNNQ